MPREHAKLLLTIGRDEDFSELAPLEQWLYLRILALPELTYAGVVHFKPKMWARMSTRVEVEDVEKAFEGLVGASYLLHDEESHEVLVRTFMRNDGIVKQPKVFIAAIRAALAVDSAALRSTLADELERLRPESKQLALAELDAALEQLRRNPSRNPSANPSRKGLRNPSRKGIQETLPDTLPGTPAGEGFREPFPKPPVAVAVEIPDVKRSSGGSRAHAREAAPTPIGGPRNTAPCRRHPDDDRPCRHCRDIRLADHPRGYDPRPAADIPDDEIDIDAWADAPADLAPPVEVELSDDPTARPRWYAQAKAEQRAERAEQARQRLGRYQREHCGVS